MILLAVLAMLQATPSPEAPDPIVVTGHRIEQLKRLRMRTKIDRRSGATRCIFKRRSGDPALDAAVCNAVLACVPKVKTAEEMQLCVAPTMDRLVGQGGGFEGMPWQAEAAKDRR